MPWLRSWYGPLLFGVLVYFSIAGFGNTDDYNDQVSTYATIAAATYLLVALFQGKRPAASSLILLLSFALALSIGVSTWLAPSMYWAFNRLHLYYGIVLLGVGVYLTHRDADTGHALRFMLVVPVIHAIFLVDVIFFLLSKSDDTQHIRQLPHFANIRHFAYLGFLASCCSVAAYVGSRKFELSAFLLTVAGIFGIVLLGARGALLAWLLFCAVLSFFLQWRARFIVFCILSLFTGSSIVWGLAEAGFLHGPSLFRRLDHGGQSALHVMDRVSVWADAIRAIAERPWFGFGPDAYIQSRCCNPTLAQPHNFIIQILLEFGVVGGLILVALIWAVIRDRSRDRFRPRLSPEHPVFVAMSALLIGFLAYSLIDGLLYHAVPLLHFAVFVALFLAMSARPASAVRSNCSDS